MKASSSMFLICILSLLFHSSFSSTMVVDGVTEWKNPTADIGDSIIFKHKSGYELYIFQNKGAFKSCNFARATLLTKPNSNSFIWHPSRPGFFYFTFNNGSTKPCQGGQKLAIKVSLSSSPAPRLEDSATSPNISPFSPSSPFSGGIASSSPVFPWPFQPKESLAPSPSKTEFLPAGPTSAPRRGGGLPFINSNPVVTFPTGEVDSATIRPFPTSQGQVVVGFLAAQMALCFATFVLLLAH